MKVEEMIKEIITQEINKLDNDEIVKLSNSISDGDMSTCKAFHIYKMEDFNDYCEQEEVEFLELVEDLGKIYRFETDDKYFMAYNGSIGRADDLISFNSLFEVNEKQDFINWVTDEVINTTEFDAQEIVKNSLKQLIKEGDI